MCDKASQKLAAFPRKKKAARTFVSFEELRSSTWQFHDEAAIFQTFKRPTGTDAFVYEFVDLNACQFICCFSLL